AGADHRAARGRARRRRGAGRRCAVACAVRSAGRGSRPDLAFAVASAEDRIRGLAVKGGAMEPIRILLVEDDPPTRRRLHEALAADPGFEVASVDNIADARAALAADPPKVLVTDLELPDGHGTALTAEVRANHPDIEVLVISVLCDERNVVAAIAAGASG